MNVSPKTVFIDDQGIVSLQDINEHPLICPWTSPYMEVKQGRIGSAQAEMVFPPCNSLCPHFNYDDKTKEVAINCSGTIVANPIADVKTSSPIIH